MEQFILNLYDAIVPHVGWDWVYMPVILSTLFLIVRKWRLYRKMDSLLRSERFVNTLVILIAFGEVVADYLLHTPLMHPALIPIQGAFTRFLMHDFYTFILKPGYPVLKAAVAKQAARFQRSVDSARQYNLDVKAAAVPVDTER